MTLMLIKNAATMSLQPAGDLLRFTEQKPVLSVAAYKKNNIN